jgi:D-beta-D-heptose 7-phosphate kinase/D-beta-D-heptose 1-phosphate adenosyltransferase
MLTKARLGVLMRRFPDTKVLVVGDFILDQFIWGKVDRISPEAPVPVVQIERDSYMPGGSLNVAHNILTLGGKVFPCGVMGRDLLGRMLVRVMKSNGVDTDGVIYSESRPTTHKTRVIAHSQQVVRFDREVEDEIPAKDRQRILKYVERKISEVDSIVIEDYGKGVVTPQLIRGILRLAKRFKKFVLVDPKERHFSYYRGVTVITPNRKEAYGAVGVAVGVQNGGKRLTVEEVGRRILRKLRCEAVLVTLGEEGMMLLEKAGRVTRIPTAAREVFDVSGAGDTVVATLAIALASGADLREAAFISNLAAGVVVGKLGTATVNPNELARALGGMQNGKGAP